MFCYTISDRENKTRENIFQTFSLQNRENLAPRKKPAIRYKKKTQNWNIENKISYT